MEKIMFANFFVYVIVSGVGVSKGLDLKKWASWLYGLYGFLSGFWLGFLQAGASLGLQVGALFAFIVMYGGAMIHMSKQSHK